MPGAGVLSVTGLQQLSPTEPFTIEAMGRQTQLHVLPKDLNELLVALHDKERLEVALRSGNSAIPERHAFILNKSREYLENSPGFNKDHWPETNSHARQPASRSYGAFMGINTGAEY